MGLVVVLRDHVLLNSTVQSLLCPAVCHIQDRHAVGGDPLVTDQTSWLLPVSFIGAPSNGSKGELELLGNCLYCLRTMVSLEETTFQGIPSGLGVSLAVCSGGPFPAQAGTPGLVFLQGWSSSAGSMPQAHHWLSQTCLRGPA